MGFLVGNDFIPHLPNMHINKGALPELYTAYKVSFAILVSFFMSEGMGFGQ
jgi:5'-3' exoribonuclease 1